jgi:tetratricopeptide (TPR) repeat protein
LERATPTPSATRAGALDWAGYLSDELGEDGRAPSEQAVACARDAHADAACALALSHLDHVLGPDRLDEGLAFLEEAQVLAEQAGDPFVLATVLNNLGVWTSRSDIERALPLFEASYRIRAEMGDVSRMALSMSNLASASFETGHVKEAHEFATQALALARDVGDRRHMHAALDNLAWIAFADARFDEARALFTEALQYAHEIAKAGSTRESLCGLATVAGKIGEGRLAARLAAAAEPDVYGAVSPDPATQKMIEETLAAARAKTDPAEWDEAWAAGAALTIEQAAAEVLKM